MHAPGEPNGCWVDGTWLRGNPAHLGAHGVATPAAAGIFETLRVHRGETVLASAHLTRMRQSAATLGLPPPPVPPTQLPEATAALLRRTAWCEGVVRWRWQARSPDRAHLVVTLAPLPPDLQTRRHGVHVVTCRVRAPAGAHKWLARQHLVRLRAWAHLRAPAPAEALLVDGAGRVLEGTTCNVFVWDGACWTTPPLDGRILPGTVRAWLLQALRRAGVPVRERAIPIEALHAANAIFLTSSIAGLAPVRTLDGRPLPACRPPLPTLPTWLTD